MYANGQGVRQNYVQAVKWIEKAAMQGHVKAQYNVGAMYANGQGVRQNLRVAKAWLGMACNNGNRLGCDGYRRLESGY
mgnify:FL=1